MDGYSGGKLCNVNPWHLSTIPGTFPPMNIPRMGRALPPGTCGPGEGWCVL